VVGRTTESSGSSCGSTLQLFRAYFTEGRDVGRHDVLAEIAGEVGLPPAEALVFLDSDAGKKEVEGEAWKGLKLGLQGVPFFVVNDVPAFSGAQMPHAFLAVFQQALGCAVGAE
jgi:predicted DsbA family dithiol-disulfide isomerase